MQAEPPQAQRKPVGTRLGFSNYLGLAGALIAMIALFSVLSSHFLTYDTFSTIANQIPDLVVMSVGMTFVLIIAGIDLSVGSVLALGASVVSVAALQWHWPALPAALLGLAAAALDRHGDRRGDGGHGGFRRSSCRSACWKRRAGWRTR